MPLRNKVIISIGLLGLLCFLLPGSLRADDFTFSLTNTTGNQPGTVTGEILGLTNNATTAAAEVILDTYPAIYGTLNPALATPPVVPSMWSTVLQNSFTETAGVITAFNFQSGINGHPFVSFLLWNLRLDITGLGVVDTAGVGTATLGPPSFSIVTAPVPEPSTLSLMLLGIGLVLVMRKRIGQGVSLAKFNSLAESARMTFRKNWLA
jgi:hypothetical protein